MEAESILPRLSYVLEAIPVFRKFSSQFSKPPTSLTSLFLLLFLAKLKRNIRTMDFG